MPPPWQILDLTPPGGPPAGRGWRPPVLPPVDANPELVARVLLREMVAFERSTRHCNKRCFMGFVTFVEGGPEWPDMVFGRMEQILLEARFVLERTGAKWSCHTWHELRYVRRRTPWGHRMIGGVPYMVDPEVKVPVIETGGGRKTPLFTVA